MSADNLSLRDHRKIEKFFQEKESRRRSPNSSGHPGRLDKSGKQRPPGHRLWNNLEQEEAFTPAVEKLRSRRSTSFYHSRDRKSGNANETVLGMVLEIRGRDIRVDTPVGVFSARPAPRLILSGELENSALAVGDRVNLEPLGDELMRINSVEPRRSALGRQAGRGHDGANGSQQVLAANIDQVLLVCSPTSPPFRPRLVDRYLVVSAWQGLPLILCLNKSDLGITPELETLLDGYARLGLRVLRTSATTGSGIPQLIEAIAGKISLLSGHSGVGKSSLLNALEPDLELRTGGVTTAKAGQGKGTHTTTSARLIKLSVPDTHLVDSPGIRAFGLGQPGPAEIAAGFPEMRRWEPDCRVRGCLHDGEPYCAVAGGMSRSAFGLHRLDSYRRLLAGHAER